MERKKGELVLSCYRIAITDPSRDTEGIGQIQDLAADRAEGGEDCFPGTGETASRRLLIPPKSPDLRTAWIQSPTAIRGPPPPAMALYPCN